jgi:nucleotide-binding universal stress UspA family protein
MENGSGIAGVPRGEGALASFFKEVGGRLGIPAKFNVCDGNPGREIARFAEGRECDLIVLASLGLTGIDRFLLGSTAERVIAGAHCPVLVVRPQGRPLLVAAHR